MQQSSGTTNQRKWNNVAGRWRVESSKPNQLRDAPHTMMTLGMLLFSPSRDCIVLSYSIICEIDRNGKKKKKCLTSIRLMLLVSKYSDQRARKAETAVTCLANDNVVKVMIRYLLQTREDSPPPSYLSRSHHSSHIATIDGTD